MKETNNSPLSEILREYKEAAERGEADAQYHLGFSYYLGTNLVNQNYDEAVKWLQRAAEQGHIAAMGVLGCCYEDGFGVNQDYSEAVKYYQKAAEQGDCDSQRNLGECYHFGHGVSQNYDKAMEWHRKAAEQSDEDAMLCLGNCYLDIQDYKKAMK
ncbi:MAG: sel1 repeat family protein [Bacteroidaceae bacterium]|nr:sel1 repeat family protein [Bacteroidaceae bacterium]